MFVFLFCLFAAVTAFAERATTSVTENDPSSFVEGVNMITGDFCMYDNWYVVGGAEPVRISEAYLTKSLFLKQTQRLITTYCRPNFIQAHEPNGTLIFYHLNPDCRGTTMIGKKFYGDVKKKRRPIRFDTSEFNNSSPGVSNTAAGVISGQTLLKNQRIVFDPHKDPKGKSFSLYAANGTVRKYVNLIGQKKTPIPYSGIFKDHGEFVFYQYKLVSETLPNGHVIQYLWHSNNTLLEIRSTNASGSKIFAQIKMPGPLPCHPGWLVPTKGSDDQILRVQFESSSLADTAITKTVMFPDKPDLTYSWTSRKKKVCIKEKWETVDFPYISSLSLPEERVLQLHYDGGDQDGIPRVSALSSPVGKDKTALTTHRFFYGNRKSHVLDIEDNKTEYEWNEQARLTRIRRFMGKDRLHSEERFVWDGPLLSCKSLLNAEGNCIQARTFSYDGLGNVTKSTFYGNLTGKGNLPQLDGAWRPSAAETCSTLTTYTQDGKHLPLRVEEPDGLVTLYTYVSGTNLVKTKTLCEGNSPKIFYTYEYDADFLLVKETVDDGVMKTVKRITPRQSQPYIGMPETIEETYIENDQEILLRKTVFHYRKGATIEHKDVYDAKGVFQYRLSYEYDEKNRVIGETNALGQKTEVLYSLPGNRIFSREPSGRVEQTSDYDYVNRLTENTWVCDGKSRTHLYSYDTKSRLEWESDERGHKTYYSYNAFGQCTKTIYPPIPSETGELRSPTIEKDYDSLGNEIWHFDAKGRETRTEYNAYNKPIRVIHPDGSEESYTYTLSGLLKSHTDVLGVVTSYRRDYLGRVVEKTISSEGAVLAQETQVYVGYHLKSRTDAEGNQTVYIYDQAGRKTSETCGKETIFYEYDALGRAYRIRTGMEITCKTYDLLDRVIEEKKENIFRGVLEKILYTYDAAGNQESVTRFVDGKEAKETCIYDGQQRLIQKTNALGYVETIAYIDVLNDYGQTVLQKTHTDALGLQTIETFDTQGKVSQIEKRKEKSLSLTQKFYTLTGNLELQIDTIFTPDGTSHTVHTRWEYDAMDRVAILIEAEGTPEQKVTRKTYTLRGEPKTVTKPDGVTLFYKYNGLGQLIEIDASDGSIRHRMSYNRLGHLQTSDGITRKTDPKGRILEETFPAGYTLYNEFDAYGRKDVCRIPAADCYISYTYTDNVLHTITRKTSDQRELYSHAYLARDLSRHIIKERLINGLGEISSTFDLLSRRTFVHSPFFSQRILSFDPVGNILSMQIQQDVMEYGYDALYQLTEEKSLFAHQYSYDSMHNRLSKDHEAYQINDLNQVVSHLAYNLNGCPTKRGDTKYVYDALDRLVEIITPTFTQRFQYDSLHRCLSKITTKNGAQTIRHFLYDGQKEIGAFDESLQIQELRILGETSHAEIGASIAIELDGEVYLPLHDLQGNIAALIGSQSTFYRYSAFGEERIDGPLLSPWRFSSKRSDRDTQLVYYGRRFYIPELGRWLTPDPAGFTDGMNLYAFVHNDPLIHFDEYGLYSFTRENSFNWNYTSYPIASRLHQPTFADINPRFVPKERTRSAILPSLSPNSSYSPHYYLNGILNSREDCIAGAQTLYKTLNCDANVIPAYSRSYGPLKDFRTVCRIPGNSDYSSTFIRMFARELTACARSMDASGDPRKIFITAFSRGVGDTYHTVRALEEKHRNRLIITACGGIMVIPRNFGFIVNNLVSEGDWCSKILNGVSNEYEARKKTLDMFRETSNFSMLRQRDSHGAIGDHFFQSRTYQQGIADVVRPLYEEYGLLK